MAKYDVTRAIIYRRNQSVDLVPDQVDNNFLGLDTDLATLTTGVENLTVTDISGAAPIDDPTFTGTVVAPIFSGSGSGLTGIPNTSLVNSTITLGTTVLPLGGATYSLQGLSSVVATLFTGNLAGTANNAALFSNQPASFYTTTSNINEGSNLYFTQPRVLATALTGFTAKSGGTLLNTDSVLSGLEKLEFRTALDDAKISYPGPPAFSQITNTPTTLTGYGITLTGDVNSVANVITIPSSVIMGKNLEGYSLGENATLTSTDTIEQAFGKVQAQIDFAEILQVITLSGDATGSGTSDVEVTLADSGVSAGTYNTDASTLTPFTVDSKGRVTSTGDPFAITLNWANIWSTPTTLDGYGITDGVNVSQLGVASGVAQLDDTGHVPTSQLPAAVLGNMDYQGVWDASINNPPINSGVGSKGYYYKVSVSGRVPVDGISQWNLGDIIAFNGTTWDKIDGLASEVTSVAGRVGAVTLAIGDISGGAPSNSPTFTGSPQAPTPAQNDASSLIATTQWVSQQGGINLPQMDSSSPTPGDSPLWAHDNHSHPIDTSRAPLDSPALTGIPSADTAVLGTSTSQLATTAFATAAANAIIVPVTSVFNRIGDVVLQSSDVTGALGYTPYDSVNPAAYISGITASMVDAALGYTPYDSANPNAYISGITASMVDSALGYTPYDSANPTGYQTAAQVAASTVKVSLACSGNSLTATTATAANTLNISGTPTTFVWSNPSNAPTYVWGTNAQGSSWLASVVNMSVGYATNAGIAALANTVPWTGISGKPGVTALSFIWNWASQTGQPSYVWGGSDGTNMYAYNPSNFSVNYAATAGNANYATTAGSAPANGGTSAAVTINYNNNSNSTYQVLWGSGNGVYGNGSIYVNPAYGYIYANEFMAGSGGIRITDQNTGSHYQLVVRSGVLVLVSA